MCCSGDTTFADGDRETKKASLKKDHPKGTKKGPLLSKRPFRGSPEASCGGTQGAYAVAASSEYPLARVTSMWICPSRTSAVNSSPSVQCWLIGSLILFSITRLRNRAP